MAEQRWPADLAETTVRFGLSIRGALSTFVVFVLTPVWLGVVFTRGLSEVPLPLWILLGAFLAVTTATWFSDRGTRPLISFVVTVLVEVGKLLRDVLIGNYLVRRHLEQWESTLHLYREEASIGAVLRSSRQVVRGRFRIVFSHRGENKRQQEKNAKEHGALIDRYQRPPFPEDEADLIMFIWSLLAASLGREDIVIQCACQFQQLRYSDESEVTDDNLVLIGSTKYNSVVADVQSRAIRRYPLPYRFEHEKKKVAVGNRRPYLRVSASLEERGEEDKRPTDTVDYAMALRIPNPWRPDRSVLVLGGCHRAGQWAILKWLRDHAAMSDLVSNFPNQPFCSVVSHEFRTNPRSPEYPELIGQVMECGTFEVEAR